MKKLRAEAGAGLQEEDRHKIQAIYTGMNDVMRFRSEGSITQEQFFEQVKNMKESIRALQEKYPVNPKVQRLVSDWNERYIYHKVEDKEGKRKPRYD